MLNTLAIVLLAILLPSIILARLRETAPPVAGRLAPYYRAEPGLFLDRKFMILTFLGTLFLDVTSRLMLKAGWIDSATQQRIFEHLAALCATLLGVGMVLFAGLMIRAAMQLGKGPGASATNGEPRA